MNREAERHLTKAEGFLAKGEDFYRKAAEEIVAAKAADFMLSNREIGERFGRSEKWVRNLVRWITTSSDPTKMPYSDDTPRRQVDMARQVLKEAPLEQVERIISELPKERKVAVGAAAGHAYLKARQDYDEAEKRMTPAELKEREAAKENITLPVRKAVASFTTLGIAGHLEQATEELAELVADNSLSAEALKAIETAFDAFVTEYQVARAMVGLEAWEEA